MPNADRQKRFEEALSPAVYGAAWRFGCRLADCREDAEDLLQEALATAFARFDQLRDPLRFTPWLLAIVRRCHLMKLRERSRRPRQVDVMREPVAEPDAPGFSGEVRAALAGLPERQRTLLALVYAEELSQVEAAQVLGVSPAGVRMQLTRARRALRRAIERQWAEDADPRSVRVPKRGE
ncbi:sigma-70 family RNA polymerase sigma factor [bacterium]|nr:sigma-70 family RNA polymerase sigma factor [bacterium]